VVAADFVAVRFAEAQDATATAAQRVALLPNATIEIRENGFFID
jgi:hypothetical protein